MDSAAVGPGAGTTATSEAEPSSSVRCPFSAAAKSFDPFDDGYLQNPYPVFAALRAEEPVFYYADLGYWVVSRYEDIRQVFLDPESFSATATSEVVTPPGPGAMAALMEAMAVPRPAVVDEDPPSHTARRQVLRTALSPERVREFEPDVRRYTTEAIDRIAGLGHADLVLEVADEVPALIAFRLMGIPETEVRQAKQFATKASLFSWGRPDEEQQTELARDFGEYYKFARQHVNALLQEPGDDYVSTAIKASREPGTEGLFDELDLYTLMVTHFFAAHETTTNTVANGLRALLEDRAQWEALGADPSLIPQAVEEVLRHGSSIVTWRRRATRPVTVGGVELPAEARLLLLTGSANHDEALFADPERFDIQRDNASRHLTFGWGIHRCLGENLARMEIRVILEELTSRLPGLRLVADQTWSYLPNVTVRGPEALLVEWDLA
jgi:cytochrome P450